MSGYGKTTLEPPVTLPDSVFTAIIDGQEWDHLFCENCDDLYPLCAALGDQPCSRCGEL